MSTSATLEVARPVEDDISAMYDDLTKTTGWQSWISAGLITAAGFMVFQKTFVGTPDDFFAALLWGFTADIGVAKVLELAQPITKLKPSFARLSQS